MNLSAPFLAVVLLSAITTTTQASVVTSVSGATTTYTENFDGATSFASSDYVVPANKGDDYLWVTSAGATAFNFTSATALQSIAISFWYSAPDGVSGSVGFDGTSVVLADVPGVGAEFSFNNPGADTLGTFGTDDGSYTLTLTDVAAGSHTLSFASTLPFNYTFGGLKIDDLKITTIAVVPEPETLALMLAGLGFVGWIARRRTAVRG